MTKDIILLGNRNEAERLNNLLRLLYKYNLNTIIFDSEGISIDNRIVKAGPFDEVLFYDLICAAGIDPKNKALQFKHIQLYSDGVLSGYSLAFNGSRVVLQPVSAEYFNTL